MSEENKIVEKSDQFEVIVRDAPPKQCQITIVAGVHLIGIDEPTQSAEIRTCQFIDAKQDEQKYERRNVLIDHVPTLLDTGWIQTPGYIVIENVTAVNCKNEPTDKQREENRAIKLEVRSTADRDQPPMFVVSPQLPLIAELGQGNIYICASGGYRAKYNITVFPK